MSVKEEPRSSLLVGSYKAFGSFYSSIGFDGNKAVINGTNGTTHAINVNVGEFGEAEAEIAKTTGQHINNIEFTYSFGGKFFSELGVISEDGLTITMAGIMGLMKLKWMTADEAAALEAEGDPIEARPGPYMIQPDNLGKFLWITGPPGLGKSTSAQLLGKTAGYVYYEADCFGSCKNPYIPLDVDNPSLAQVNQKRLKGEGLEERREICKRTEDIFGKVIKGEDFEMDAAKEFYGAMCDDIKQERLRIGGDWAIAAVTLSRELRDFIRCQGLCLVTFYNKMYFTDLN